MHHMQQLFARSPHGAPTMAIATINPATGELVKKFDAFTDAQVDEKISRAANSFRSFRKTSFADRARWMKKAGDILVAEKDSLGRLMTLEMGKTLASAVAEAEKCASAAVTTQSTPKDLSLMKSLKPRPRRATSITSPSASSLLLCPGTSLSGRFFVLSRPA